MIDTIPVSSLICRWVIDSDNLDENDVLDVRLIERVFTTPIINVYSISLKCRFDFPRALKYVLLKVFVERVSVGA